MLYRLGIGWFCCTLALFAAPLCAQVSSSIIPTADAFVTTGPAGNDRSHDNYGGAGALSVAAPGKAQGEFQTLMKFNLASTIALLNSSFGAGNWTLQSITLQLVAQNPGNPVFNSSSAGSFSIVWQQNDAWLEGTGSPGAPTTNGVTFADLPSVKSAADTSLGTFAFNGATSGTASYTLSLPAAFVNDLTAGGDVSLRFVAADANVSYLFGSRNMPNTASRPVLTIVAVPEPASVTLVLLALSVLGLRLTRRRRAQE